MTTEQQDRLYRLLPVVHRMRDAEMGEPLRGLLSVISEQVNIVEDDIAGLYENWFIETCADWVVPYIGDLVGYVPAVDPGLAADQTTPSGQARARAIFPRTEIANTIRNRRGKGKLALLEMLAHDAAGWPARAVEFFKLLAWNQNVNYLHLRRARRANMRDGNALELIGTAFDRTAHNVDVRRINSRRRRGYYNIPNVGLFACRLKPYRVTATPAYCVEEVGPNCFTFSVLGNNAPLFINPQPEPDDSTIARELNLPLPIRRRALARDVADYVENSFSIAAPGWLRAGSPMTIRAADLSDWAAYRPRRNMVAVDPVLGRMLFPPDQPPKNGVTVTYHYGFSADMGGGEYIRQVSAPEGAIVYPVGPAAQFKTITAALNEWKMAKPKDAVIEIVASGVYVEPLVIEIPEGASLQLRAASGVRPVVRLIDWQTSQSDALTIDGAAQSRMTLHGLLITGRAVRATGKLAALSIRHCTLVPGWGLENDCSPTRPSEPSLEIFSNTVCVRIEHSIVGSIQVTMPPPDDVIIPVAPDDADMLRCGGYHADPIGMVISDSIIDATSEEREAIGASGCAVAHVSLCVARTTMFGKVQVHAIELGEDSIFDGEIFVARRQTGCLRFSYVYPGSRTPRRFECQPRDGNGVAPHFNSVRYGHPAYAQLADDCPAEISSGASDQSEMGAFHDLYQPQRTTLLRTRLEESVPAGFEAGIIFLT